MGKRSVIIVALVLLLVAAGAAGPTLTASASDPVGCTPGFWRQPHHFRYWPEQFETTTLVREVFEPGCLMTNGILDLNRDGTDDTLLDALNYRGGRGLSGMARIMLRAATARLLSLAAMVPTQDQGAAIGNVVYWVNWSIDEACVHGERAAMEWLAEQYDRENNAGACTVKP